MSKGRGAKGPAAEGAPKLRSVVARSREKQFGTDLRTQAFKFRRGIQASLLLLRVQKNPDKINQELLRFDALSAYEANRFSRQPIGFDYLSFLKVPKPISLSQEISWLGSRLAREAELISLFVTEKLRIEEDIFGDKPQEALERIEALEALAGVSLWSVTLTISILQWFYGTDEQKNFVTRIRQLNKVAMLPYIANYSSQLCEETVSLTWYRQNLKRRLTGREVSDITVYMESKLGECWRTDDDGIAARLRVEQNHHNFDIYEALVGALQTLIAREAWDTSLMGAIESACQSLSTIPDPRLIKLRWRLHPEEMEHSVEAPVRSMDLLLRGEVAAADKAARTSLEVSPNSIYDVIVCAAADVPTRRSRLKTGSSMTDAVIAGLRPVLSRSTLPTVRRDQLEKLCVMFCGLSCASALLALIRAEESSDPDEYLSLLRTFATASNTINAIDCALLAAESPPPSSALSDALNRMRLHSSDESGQLSHEVAVLVKSFQAAVSGNGAAAVEARALLQSRSGWVRARAALIVLRGCVLQGDLGHAAQIISTQVCVNGVPADLLPVEGVFRGLTWKMLEDHASTIQFLNAFHVYAEQTSDDTAATHRHFALAKFLKSAGVKLPSELRASAQDYDPRELSYFLGKVCVPHVIDMLRQLRSSSAVLEERRAICSVILSITRLGVGEYEDEIVSITKELAVQQGLRAYDGSRIHVDRVGLKKVLKNRLSESYMRYTSLVQAGVGLGGDFDEILRDLIKNEVISKSLLAIPDNEADELLYAIMAEVRGGFLLNIPHGLDSYLSKRVRHGSIVGHIRSAVEQESVIFQKNSAQRYSPDGKITSGLPFSEAEQVNTAISSMSKAFDSYLIRLKDVVLHVRTLERPLGIFDLSYNLHAVNLIRSAYKTDATFDGLLDSVLTVYWSLIAPSLAHAQHILKVEASEALTEQLDAVRRKVLEVVTDGLDRSRISGALSRAMINVQGKLETAASWFDPAHLEAREFTAAEAVGIGVASVRSIHFGFEPKVEIFNDESTSIEATYLPIFVDILFVIFGNIAEHADTGNSPSCVVKISQNVADGLLKLRVENEVSLKESFGRCVSRIEERKVQIQANELSSRVRQESGSGLPKLWSIVSQSSRGRLDFGYTNERIFFVDIELSLVGDEALDELGIV